jgi:ABC-2 type transport system permease protein
VNNLANAELRKLATTTSSRLTAAIAITAAPTLTVINTYTAGHNGQPPLTTSAGLHHVLNSGVLVAMVMLGLGIVATAGEHRHGTIVPTLLAEPRRRRILAAKIIVYAGVGAAVAAVSFAFAVAAAVPALAGHHVHHLPADTHLMLAGAVAEGAIFAVIGVALGAITRNTVGAVTAAVTWVALVEAVLIHSAVPQLAKWLPSGAAMALDRTTAEPTALLHPPTALTVLVAYAVSLSIIAAHAVAHRDVL